MNNAMIEIMNEQQKEECPVCMEEYSVENRAVEIGTCSHSVCGVCVGGMKTAGNTVRDTTTGLRVLKCPICRASGEPTKGELTAEIVRLREEVASLRTRPVQRPTPPINPAQQYQNQVQRARAVAPPPRPATESVIRSTVFSILTVLARIRDEPVSTESAANFVLLETDWEHRMNPASNLWVDGGATRHQIRTALTQTRAYVVENRPRTVPASTQRARQRTIANGSFEWALTEIRNNPVDDLAVNTFARLDAQWNDMITRGVFLGDGEIATTRERIQEAFNQTRAYVVANRQPNIIQHPTLLTRGIGAVASVFASISNTPLIPSPAPIHRFVGMPDHEVRFILRSLQPVAPPTTANIGEVGILGYIGNAERDWTVFNGHGTDARLWNTAPTIPQTSSGRIIAGRFYHNDFLIPRTTRTGGSVAHRGCGGNPQCTRRVGRRCPRGCGAFCCQTCGVCSNENCANMNQ